jgi:hypothetical protein
VRASALDVCDEPDAAGVMLMSWIVETTALDRARRGPELVEGPGGGLAMLFLHPLFMNEDLS